MAHVGLQLGEQGDSSSHRGVLKHILLPVLTLQLGFLWHICREVVTDDFLLPLIVNHLRDAVTVGLYCLLQLTALTHTRCQHDMGGCFKVIAPFYIIKVGIAPVSLAHNLPLQVLCKGVERVGHLAHLLCLLIPLTRLLRILLHGSIQFLIYRLVLRGRVDFGTIQTFVHEREAFEHIGRHVERKHCHEHNVHQIDHLLART